VPTVNIVRIETVKAGVNSDFFNPFTDPITLRMTINYSADILQLPEPTVRKTFQILTLDTNTVVEQWRFQSSIPGPAVYSWVDLPTANALGLNWTGSDIFGFRGAVEVFSFQGESGLVSIDAFDVSDIHWFRLAAVFIA
jgi:hypothetical protein